MNHQWVHASWTPPSTSLPTPSLCVVPEQWLWVPCFMHKTCTGHLFYIRQCTCFNANFLNHPTLAFSESKSLIFTSVSLLLIESSFSKFCVYVLIYCIRFLFLSYHSFWVENPIDRAAWWAVVHGAIIVKHNLATKPPPPTKFSEPSGLNYCNLPSHSSGGYKYKIRVSVDSFHLRLEERLHFRLLPSSRTWLCSLVFLHRLTCVSVQISPLNKVPVTWAWGTHPTEVWLYLNIIHLQWLHV